MDVADHLTTDELRRLERAAKDVYRARSPRIVILAREGRPAPQIGLAIGLPRRVAVQDRVYAYNARGSAGLDEPRGEPPEPVLNEAEEARRHERHRVSRRIQRLHRYGDRHRLRLEMEYTTGDPQSYRSHWTRRLKGWGATVAGTLRTLPVQVFFRSHRPHDAARQEALRQQLTLARSRLSSACLGKLEVSGH